MTKKDSEKRIIELEDLVNNQKRIIDVLYIQLDEKSTLIPIVTIDNKTCPMGGIHQYIIHTSGGWQCKCGKTEQIIPFHSTTT